MYLFLRNRTFHESYLSFAVEGVFWGIITCHATVYLNWKFPASFPQISRELIASAPSVLA